MATLPLFRVGFTMLLALAFEWFSSSFAFNWNFAVLAAFRCLLFGSLAYVSVMSFVVPMALRHYTSHIAIGT